MKPKYKIGDLVQENSKYSQSTKNNIGIIVNIGYNKIAETVSRKKENKVVTVKWAKPLFESMGKKVVVHFLWEIQHA